MFARAASVRALCALLVLCGTTSAAGQTAGGSGRPGDRPQPAALKGLSLEELGNIEVTSARKHAETVWETSSAIYVITQEDIRRSGAITIPDALRLAPGVLVFQSDANRWAVGIRGLADIFSKDVLVLIDGRSVYTPLVGGVHWAIQDVLLADVEQIEVIRGPGGSIWGANAVNGVINIITRSARQTHGTRVTIAGGNVEHARASVRYGAAGPHQLHYRLYGKLFDRGAQFHADGSNFDAWRSGQAGFRADWMATPRDDFMLSGDIYRTRTGERAEVSTFTPVGRMPVDGRVNLTGGNLILRWERELTNGTKSRLQAYYDHTDRDGFTFGESRHTVDLDFNVRMPARRRHAVAFGAATRISPSTVTRQVPTLEFVPSRKAHTLFSAFVQDDISLLPGRVALSAGLKVEDNEYTGPELLPSARIIWTPGLQQSLWGAVTRTIRTPSRFERDLQFRILVDPSRPAYAAIVGSPDFDSETMVGLEAGYRKFLSPALSVDIAAFYNDYDGLAGQAEAVVSSETSPIDHLLLTFPFANVVNARARGVEVAPAWKATRFWQLKGSYSYLRLTAANEPGFTATSARDAYAGFAPKHQARIQSRIDLTGAFELDQTYRFVDALPAGALRRYHSLDARLGWRWSPRVELSVTGQNLLQPHHPEFNAVPVEIRRAAYAQLVLTR